MRASSWALVPEIDLFWRNDRDIYPLFIQWHSWNSDNPFLSPLLDWFLTQCLWGGSGGWGSTQLWPVRRPLGLKLPRWSTQHLPLDPSADLSADGSHTAGPLHPKCPISAGHGGKDGLLVVLQSDWPFSLTQDPACTPRTKAWSTITDNCPWMSWLQWGRRGSPKWGLQPAGCALVPDQHQTPYPEPCSPFCGWVPCCCCNRRPQT